MLGDAIASKKLSKTFTPGTSNDGSLVKKVLLTDRQPLKGLSDVYMMMVMMMMTMMLMMMVMMAMMMMMVTLVMVVMMMMMNAASVTSDTGAVGHLCQSPVVPKILF